MKPIVKTGGLCLALLLLLLTGASCGTIPPGKGPADWLHILPADVSYYLCLSTKNTKDLLKKTLQQAPFYTKDMDQLIDMTKQIYIGVKLNGKEKPELSMVLLGGYPSFINSVFGWSKDWQEVKGESSYWKSTSTGLEAAAPESYIIVIAQENITELLSNFKSGGCFDLSEQVVADLEANDLTLLFPLGIDDAAADSLGLSVRKKIIEHLWVAARADTDRFNFAGVFTLAPDVNAESFKKLMQFAFLAAFRDNKIEGAGERLSAIQFLVDDRLVKVSDFYLTKTEIETLAGSLLAKGL